MARTARSATALSELPEHLSTDMAGKTTLVRGIITVAVAALCLGGASDTVQAGHKKHDHPPKHMGTAQPSPCHVSVHVTENAERQPGSALYEGPGNKA